jgi:hypothetical protein
MNRRTCSIALAAGAMAFLLEFPVLAAAQPVIAAHRAIYDLQIKRTKDGSNLTAVAGRMVFELAGSKCDGWTVNFRMVNEFRTAEAPPRLVDSRSSSFEAADNLSMRYNFSEFVDNRLESEKRLSAELKADGSGGAGKLEMPKAEDFALPAGAMFPIQHQLRLMTAAEEGKPRDVSIVYDGGDGAKTYRTVTFIGPRKPPGSVEPTLATGGAVKLKLQASWPMTLSYFSNGGVPEASQNPDTPAYQVGFDMYANGVADRLVLDYGDFALDGKLSQLEFLDQPACN